MAADFRETILNVYPVKVIVRTDVGGKVTRSKLDAEHTKRVKEALTEARSTPFLPGGIHSDNDPGWIADQLKRAAKHNVPKCAGDTVAKVRTARAKLWPRVAYATDPAKTGAELAAKNNSITFEWDES